MTPPLRLLHIHSTFDVGGKETRAVRLMNAFDGAAQHVVVSAMPGALAARAGLAADIVVDFPAGPPLTGAPGPARLREIARFCRGFDLVLTYNWGAMDAVMARRMFGGPPMVHHEDGFNNDAAALQDAGRVLWRRFALPAACRVVVPSRTLERIALDMWRQPPGRVVCIGNGIDNARFVAPPAVDAIPGLRRAAGETVVGTVAGLRPVKNLSRLVRAFAAASRMGGRPMRLVIVGDGPDRAAIVAEAERSGVAAQLLLPGFLPDPARYLGLFDIFALSSDSEQFPLSLIEAMAAGLPVAATAVGDVPAIVASENSAFVVQPAEETAFADAIRVLADGDALRRRLGAANRRHARENFGEERMIDAYRALYAAAAGKQLALS